MAVNRAAAVPIIFIGLVAMAQVSEAKNCPSNVLLPLVSCLSAISGSRPLAPTAQCCRTVKAANINCVCQAYTSGQIPKSVNKKLVLGLPKKCNKSIPKNYRCGGIKL